jgi:hypothetical protein
VAGASSAGNSLLEVAWGKSWSTPRRSKGRMTLPQPVFGYREKEIPMKDVATIAH